MGTTEKTEMQEFTIQISRELGSIGAKLDNIFVSLTNQTKEIDALWARLTDTNKELTNLKLKVIAMATAISILLNAPNILNTLKLF